MIYELIRYQKRSDFVENKYDELISSVYLPLEKRIETSLR